MKLKNPYERIVYNIGYIGEGKYNRVDHNKIYKVWHSMFQRCYEPYKINKCPSYQNCTVSEEWYNFQNFAKWYEDNYYEIENDRLELDKDILIKGNKIYSPETCCLVPRRINSMFVKSDADRGECPIGVCWDKERNLYKASCAILVNNKRKGKHLGRFDNKEDAFNAYKIFKENYIKQVADEYKEFIPNKLYKAMYEYTIEIND